MPKSRYKNIYDREFVAFGDELLKFECCDCGLVHTLRLRVRDGKLGMVFSRDSRATTQRRIARGVKIHDVVSKSDGKAPRSEGTGPASRRT